MIPVFQTTFGNGDGSDGLPCGNCLSACLASILHVLIEDVPNFSMLNDSPIKYVEYGDSWCAGWFDHMADWLESFNLYPIYVLENTIFDEYYIGLGYTKRGMRHAVVCFNGEIVHDPFPDQQTDEPFDGIVLTDFIILRSKE